MFQTENISQNSLCRCWIKKSLLIRCWVYLLVVCGIIWMTNDRVLFPHGRFRMLEKVGSKFSKMYWFHSLHTLQKLIMIIRAMQFPSHAGGNSLSYQKSHPVPSQLRRSNIAWVRLELFSHYYFHKVFLRLSTNDDLMVNQSWSLFSRNPVNRTDDVLSTNNTIDKFSFSCGETITTFIYFLSEKPSLQHPVYGIRAKQII